MKRNCINPFSPIISLNNDLWANTYDSANGIDHHMDHYVTEQYFPVTLYYAAQGGSAKETCTL